MRVAVALLSLLSVFATACASGGGSDTGGDVRDAWDAEDAVPDVPEVLPDVPDVTPDTDALPDGDVPAEDAGDGEADGPEGDVPDAARTMQAVVTMSAGGGTVRTDRFQLTLGIGVPQPMGSGASDAHSGAVGPGAVLNQ